MPRSEPKKWRSTSWIGDLREVGERSSRSGRSAGSRSTVPFEFHVGGEAVGGHEEPVRSAGQRLSDVDVPVDRRRQRRAVDRRGADLGELRALRFVFRVEGEFVVGAADLAVGGVGRRARSPSGSVIVAARISDGDGAVGLCVCGTLSVDVEARRAVGRVGRRRCRQARVEDELVAAGRRRPRAFSA